MSSQEDLHRTFRAVLEALARPGRWTATPAGTPEGAIELLRQAAWDGDVRVAITDSPGANAALAAADPGSEEEPELSTTVMVVGTGPENLVSIDGPGVRETFTLGIPIDDAALERRRALCANFPLGVDMVFVDAQGRVMGLPRTTVVSKPR